MVLDQLIAEAEIALRQREQEREEEQRAAEHEQAAKLEAARQALIDRLGGLWDELRPFEVNTYTQITRDGKVYRYCIKFAPPHLAPFWVELNKVGDLNFSIVPDGYAVGQSELGEFLLERRRAYVENAQKRARDLEVAGRVIRAAKTFVREHEEYVAACRLWVEAQTARLWRPWSAWLVRYTPIFSQTVVVELRLRDDDGEEIDLSDILIREVMVLGDRPGGQSIVPIVHKDGRRDDLFIGALLDARRVRFDAPSISQHLDYHRTFYAGGFCVNVPPEIDEDPPDPPSAPDMRIDTSGASPRLLGWINSTAVGELADLTPEELVESVYSA